MRLSVLCIPESVCTCQHAACRVQVVVLLPLFTFCYCMYVWERSELVPIRPAEGEELPVNMLGARPLREAKFLETLERRLSGAASASVSKAPY